MTRPSTSGAGRPRGPRRSSRIRLGLAAVGVIVLTAVAYGGWYLFLRPGGPPPVDLGALPLTSPSAATSAGASAGSGSPTASLSAPASASSAGAPSASAAASTGASSSGRDGAWQVDSSIGSGDTGSFVGYRIQEQLAGVGANTAVGRTSTVTGTFTLQGTTISAATFTADLTGLKSDDQRRDGTLRREGLETDTYPTATFKLTTPIDLGSMPADGVIVPLSATGQLTLHGQARTVTIPLKARISANVIAVTGTLPITLSDYGMQAPRSFAVLSVADQGTMELQLMFAHA